ncbi:MAG: type II toxin-antitoxin system HicB family antitoxin [Synergistaceae bacterium]|nr:type II toxin-antitoxin system HicB family antitoxin [Synergistaceae bacterium]
MQDGTHRLGEWSPFERRFSDKFTDEEIERMLRNASIKAGPFIMPEKPKEGRYSMRYSYPAIISYSTQDKVYYVDFPDLANCFTDGQTLREALGNAEDVLQLILTHSEQGLALPSPSSIDAIHLNAGEIVSIIAADTYSQIAV